MPLQAGDGGLLVAFAALTAAASVYLGWLTLVRRGRSPQPAARGPEEAFVPPSPRRQAAPESELTLRDAGPGDGAASAAAGTAASDAGQGATPQAPTHGPDATAQSDRPHPEDLRDARLDAARFWTARVGRRFAHPHLPKAILLISFLNSFVMSFPMNFFGKFITSEIGMTPTQFQQYYAFTFLPFSFKPIYAYFIEHVSLFGSNRAAYLVACNALIAVFMFLMATVAHEVWHVFLIGFLQNIFEAAAGMVVGLVVIDVASRDQDLIPKLQAEQTMARFLGTFSALLLALPVSGCLKYDWDNRTALLASAVVPLFSSAAGLLIPSQHKRVEQSEDVSAAEDEQQSEQGPSAAAAPAATLERKAIYLFVPTIVLFEVLAICIGVKGNLHALGRMDLWRGLVVLTAVCLVGYVSGAIVFLRRMGDSLAVQTLVQISIPCIYLFVVDAVPSSLDGMSSFKFTTFSNRCELQGLSLISIISQIAGMSLFGRIFTGVPIETSVLSTTILAGSIGLLDLLKTNTDPAIGLFALWSSIDAVTGVFGSMFLLAKETIAAHFSFALERRAEKISSDREELEQGIDMQTHAPARRPPPFSPGVLYSIYLTCFDIGGSASGFLSASIISTIGISRTDFSGLSTLIIICAIAFISTSALIPTIRFANSAMHRN